MAQSPYTPLDSASEEIRVLEIAPGSYDDDLIISLRIKRLREKRTEFNALSYVWGKEKCTRRPMVNGCSVIIGQNLDGALRQLRQSRGGHPLWIDALCINQDDVAERSQQVQLMRETFSFAEQVIVWLGKERSHDQYLVDIIKQRRIPETTGEATHLSRVLRRVCQRSWFTRVWVAQEVALARRSPVMQLGARTVCWDDFYDYLDSVFEAGENLDETEIWPKASSLEFTRAYEQAFRLQGMRRVKSGDLTWQVHVAERLRATDPRDHVYGVLGICTFSPDQIPVLPDYSKSVRKVFIEASLSMLQGNTFPYRYLPLYPSLGETMKHPLEPMNLPSWAFDLSTWSRMPLNSDERNDPRRFFQGNFHNDLLKASISHLAPHSYLVGNSELHTLGLHIGTISATSKDWFYPSHPAHAEWRECGCFSPIIVYDFYHDVLEPHHIAPSSYKKAFGSGDENIKDDLFRQILIERYEFTEVANRGQISRSWTELVALLMELSFHECRVLIVTQEGHLGALYHPRPVSGVQPGDIIVGLFGMNIPFVLRSLPKNVGSSKQTYAMVNCAYVVDHQYGHDFVKESKPGAKWEDFEEFGLRQYIIV